MKTSDKTAGNYFDALLEEHIQISKQLYQFAIISDDKHPNDSYTQEAALLTRQADIVDEAGSHELKTDHDAKIALRIWKAEIETTDESGTASSRIVANVNKYISTKLKQ